LAKTATISATTMTISAKMETILAKMWSILAQDVSISAWRKKKSSPTLYAGLLAFFISTPSILSGGA
jgi:hypothetical protein